jgi:Zn-finger nucleic acid-binding protein
MERLEFKEVEIDQCRVCRGIWLDLGEIDQLFALKTIPDRLLNKERHHTPGLAVPEGERACPRCHEVLKVIEVYGITLDACSSCKGIFCDHGELSKLDLAAQQRHQDENR